MNGFPASGRPPFRAPEVLTLTGDVVNRTFIEVPTDTTVRDVIYEFGGGIPGGKKFQAVQIGGNSGALIPESLLGTEIAFDAMAAAGATLGSGAVFVLDETKDLRDVVCRMARFFEHESCGKCTPCREGTMRISGLCEIVSEGVGTVADLALLQEIGEMMAIACFCGLGQAAPTLVLTAIKHFDLLGGKGCA